MFIMSPVQGIPGSLGGTQTLIPNGSIQIKKARTTMARRLVTVTWYRFTRGGAVLVGFWLRALRNLDDLPRDIDWVSDLASAVFLGMISFLGVISSAVASVLSSGWSVPSVAWLGVSDVVLVFTEEILEEPISTLISGTRRVLDTAGFFCSIILLCLETKK